MTTLTTVRRYGVGEVIPDHGIVIDVTLTSYLVEVKLGIGTYDYVNVPFYGPNGVDAQAPVAGLVEFADGSRFGGAR